MGILIAVSVGAAMIAGAAVWKHPNWPRLPVAEALWFHTIVTWPILMKASLGSLIFASILSGEETSYTAVVYGPAFIGGMVLFATRATRPGARLFGPGILVVLGVALALPHVVFGSGNPLPALLSIAMTLPIALRSSIEITYTAWIGQARWALAAIALSIIMVGLTSPSLIVAGCRLDKCSIFGETLTSPITNNGNFLGVAVALLLPFALARAQLIQALLLAGGALILIEASGSRSALIAAGVVVLAVVISQISDRPTLGPALGLLGAIAASVTTAVVLFPPTFATYRGVLWQRARALLQGNELFGLGPSYWADNEQVISGFPNYSPHNVWLELVVSGGVVLAGLIAIAGWWAVRVVSKGARPYLLLAIVAVLAIGSLEAPLAPSKLGLTPFALLLPLIVATGYPVRIRVYGSKSFELLRAPSRSTRAQLTS